MPVAAADSGESYCTVNVGWEDEQEGFDLNPSYPYAYGGCRLVPFGPATTVVPLPVGHSHAIRITATPEAWGCYSNYDADGDPWNGYEADVLPGTVIPANKEVWLFCAAPYHGSGGIKWVPA